VTVTAASTLPPNHAGRRGQRLLYLDIDGCLLVLDRIRSGWRLADHTMSFLTWCVINFECFWLSQRGRTAGDHEGVRRAFRLAAQASVDAPEWNCLDAIRVMPWDTSKAGSIDMRSNFFWIDDAPDEQSLKGGIAR
jgi:hypothetical protein